ncbi:M20/M25/M40 family metallo-hydrolase [Dyadobacter tibetensis]|uniref:M20/M25/M40 family metallo-hydrolase n=1 Tax=Dyadobacter tibetensis TaxID=1211851 RepID=UPI00046F1F62|nr:M20/M25/M40 family metallo-hydrolase [Dyadobacter tibetensis]
MKKKLLWSLAIAWAMTVPSIAQSSDPVVNAIIKEANENSQLEKLGHELMDLVGPRLVGTPQMKHAADWAIKQYQSWGIPAHTENWGEWKGWERGITHIDMISPRVKSLQGMQLAWSPNTGGKTIAADVIILPDLSDSLAYAKWLPSVKGKFVLLSMLQPTGRPDYNWKEHAQEASFEKMKKLQEDQTVSWNERIRRTGHTSRTLPLALENAGALGIFTSYWSKGFGANKIFGAYTKKVPAIDISLEDYGMLYRLAESGHTPRISLRADSKHTAPVPAFNTIAEMKGSEKPEEYIILSAHFDSWDGGTGATDNGTGTLTMMEAIRILKKVYPNPKRTILVGHWGSEEQGLNGSRAFVEDHPEIVKNVQVVLNQDNGTGRVVGLSGQGFVDSYDYLGRWLSKVPAGIRNEVKTSFPSAPGSGGSDYASFVAAGVPAFSLSSLSWSYGQYTWHTNLDTYDKIVFDEVRNNAILTAILAYQASEDPERASRAKRVMPINEKGQPEAWPAPKSPNRKGGLD